MSEWKEVGDAFVLEVGALRAVVSRCELKSMRDLAREVAWSFGDVVFNRWQPFSGIALPVDSAMKIAEQALREMHDALVEHFAPVLRWEGNRAELLGCWELSVGEQPDGLWWWTTMLGGGFGEDDGDCTTAANARRAAEAALRALGVVFRVEGE